MGYFAAKCYRKGGGNNKSNGKSMQVGEVKETEEVSVNTLTQDFFGDFAEVIKLSV